MQARRNVVAGHQHLSSNRGVTRLVRTDQADAAETVKEEHITNRRQHGDDDVVYVWTQRGFHSKYAKIPWMRGGIKGLAEYTFALVVVRTFHAMPRPVARRAAQM